MILDEADDMLLPFRNACDVKSKLPPRVNKRMSGMMVVMVMVMVMTRMSSSVNPDSKRNEGKATFGKVEIEDTSSNGDVDDQVI